MVAEIQVYQNILNYFTATCGIYETEITFRLGVHPQDISIHKYKLKKKKLGIVAQWQNFDWHAGQSGFNTQFKKNTHTYIKNLLSLRKKYYASNKAKVQV